MKEFTIFNRPFEFLTNESQWVKLRNYLNQYLFDNKWGKYAVLLLLLLASAFLLSIVLHGLAKKAMNVSLLLAYSGVLILLFLVSRSTARGFRTLDISEYLTDTGFHETRVLITVINCLFFIPFGVFLRKVSCRGHAIINVFMIACASVGIELAQYVFSKGYTAIDDMAAYFIGGLSGLILAEPFCLVSEYLEDRHRRKRRKSVVKRVNHYKTDRNRTNRYEYCDEDEEEYYE